MKKQRLTKDAPYLLPKQRREHAVSVATELNSKDIDIEAVRRELTVPWPRPEVADRTFLRAQKAISALLVALKDMTERVEASWDLRDLAPDSDLEAVEAAKKLYRTAFGE